MYEFILRRDTKIYTFMMIFKLGNKRLHGNEICNNKCEVRVKIDLIYRIMIRNFHYHCHYHSIDKEQSSNFHL